MSQTYEEKGTGGYRGRSSYYKLPRDRMSEVNSRGVILGSNLDS